jgi:DnaJ-class molecular chaperone
MEKRDYYTVLGLNRDAYKEVIRGVPEAAMKHHPDRSPTTSTPKRNSREAKEAYEA